MHEPFYTSEVGGEASALLLAARVRARPSRCLRSDRPPERAKEVACKVVAKEVACKVVAKEVACKVTRLRRSARGTRRRSAAGTAARRSSQAGPLQSGRPPRARRSPLGRTSKDLWAHAGPASARGRCSGICRAAPRWCELASTGSDRDGLEPQGKVRHIFSHMTRSNQN